MRVIRSIDLHDGHQLPGCTAVGCTILQHMHTLGSSVRDMCDEGIERTQAGDGS